MEWARHRKHGKEDREEGKDRNIILTYEIFLKFIYFMYMTVLSACMSACQKRTLDPSITILISPIK